MTSLLALLKRLVAVGAFALTVAAIAPALASAAPPQVCTATFSVLHDDQIGALAVPAGTYSITVADPAVLTCAEASDWFRQFLEDFDGKLPFPWTVDVPTATFSARGGAAFQIVRVGGPSGGGGQHPATGLRCPGVFEVQHNDRIGTFAVPAGNYTVTLVSVGPLTCVQAMRRFAAFLQDFDGRLPAPWLLDPQTGTFERSPTSGFRIEPNVGPVPGGGATYPEGRQCPGTFRVLHNDRIGALRLPAGRYRITLAPSRRPTCGTASQLLTDFLARPSGKLPGAWQVSAASGTFSGPGEAGFRIKRTAQPR